MHYVMEPRVLVKRIAVIRVTLETMTKDIGCLNMTDGLLTFESYVQSMRDFTTLVSIELYRYGQCVRKYEKGDPTMGRFTQAYEENKRDYPPYLSGEQKKILWKEKIPVVIVRVYKRSNHERGITQWCLNILTPTHFPKAMNELDIAKNTVYTLTFDSDKKRDAAFGSIEEREFERANEHERVGNVALGPVIYTKPDGKYQQIDEVEHFDKEIWHGFAVKEVKAL